MPFKSLAQARLFYGARNTKGGLKGISQKTAGKYIKDTNHQKIGNLPRFVGLKKKMGY